MRITYTIPSTAHVFMICLVRSEMATLEVTFTATSRHQASADLDRTGPVLWIIACSTVG